MKQSVTNVVAGLLLLVSSQALSGDNSLITGAWLMSLDAQGQMFQLDLNISEGEDGLTGNIGAPEFGTSPISDVKFDGETLSFTTPDQQGGTVEIALAFEDGKLSGTLGSPMGEIPATATKK